MDRETGGLGQLSALQSDTQPARLPMPSNNVPKHVPGLGSVAPPPTASLPSETTPGQDGPRKMNSPLPSIVPQESPAEREKKMCTYLDRELSNINLYSQLDPANAIYREPGPNGEPGVGNKYLGRFLFHNKNINLLSYNCLSEADKKLYEITFLTFQDSSARDKMLKFLETLKQANIPDVRRVHKFIKDDNMDKHRVVLIDVFQNSMNLSDLLNHAKTFPEIKMYIRRDEFSYKLATIIWDTIRQFRLKGLRELGLNPNLIILLEKRATQYSIRDPVVKIKRFFADPSVVVDYKFSHFLRLILSDEKRKNAITMTDLGMINFIPKYLVEAIAKHKVEYTDELSFALILLEMLSGMPGEQLGKELDLEKGCISPELARKIDHPFFIAVINRCIRSSTHKEDMGDFFSEKNQDFTALSRLLNADIDVEPMSFRGIEPSTLRSGLLLMDKSKLVRTMSSSDYDACTQEQLEVMIEYLLEHDFLHYAFVFIKNSFARFEQYNSLFNVFPFVFFFIEKILLDDNIPYAMKMQKLHTEDLKQLMAIAPSFLFHPKFDSVPEHKAKYFEVLKLCTLYISETVLELTIRTVGVDKLLEQMNDEIVGTQGVHYPLLFVSNLIPPSYLDWRNDAHGKKFLLDYISANSLQVSDISAPDIYRYLLTALEFESTNLNWTTLTLKTAADCLFAPAFESYAYSIGTCVTDVMRGGYRPFISESFPQARFVPFIHRHRVRLPSGKIICYPCYRQKHLGEQVEIVENGVGECAEKSATPAELVPVKPEFAELSLGTQKPTFNLLKSDLVERRMNKFTVVKAGDGNIRLADAFYDSSLDEKIEKVVRTARIKVLSGGLKDSICIWLSGTPEGNIHTSKPPEEPSRGTTIIHFKKGAIQWEINGVTQSQALPRISSGDSILIALTSKQRLALYLNNLFIASTSFYLMPSTYLNIHLSGYLTSVDIDLNLKPLPVDYIVEYGKVIPAAKDSYLPKLEQHRVNKSLRARIPRGTRLARALLRCAAQQIQSLKPKNSVMTIGKSDDNREKAIGAEEVSVRMSHPQGENHYSNRLESTPVHIRELDDDPIPMSPPTVVVAHNTSPPPPVLDFKVDDVPPAEMSPSASTPVVVRSIAPNQPPPVHTTIPTEPVQPVGDKQLKKKNVGCSPCTLI
jgi:hypothetical protein